MVHRFAGGGGRDGGGDKQPRGAACAAAGGPDGGGAAAAGAGLRGGAPQPGLRGGRLLTGPHSHHFCPPCLLPGQLLRLLAAGAQPLVLMLELAASSPLQPLEFSTSLSNLRAVTQLDVAAQANVFHRLAQSRAMSCARSEAGADEEHDMNF